MCCTGAATVAEGHPGNSRVAHLVHSSACHSEHELAAAQAATMFPSCSFWQSVLSSLPDSAAKTADVLFFPANTGSEKTASSLHVQQHNPSLHVLHAHLPLQYQGKKHKDDTARVLRVACCVKHPPTAGGRGSTQPAIALLKLCRQRVPLFVTTLRTHHLFPPRV